MDDLSLTLKGVRRLQRDRLVDLARSLAAEPANRDLAGAFITYSLDPEAWDKARIDLSIDDGKAVGLGLIEIGRFEEARPWYERAVGAAQQGDVHGRIDHASLGKSLHQVGFCLSSVGKFEEAQPWFERAVEAKQQGDVHGRIDHESLGASLRAAAHCLRQIGRSEDAQR